MQRIRTAVEPMLDTLFQRATNGRKRKFVKMTKVISPLSDEVGGCKKPIRY
jgi:hypothetical protein